MITPLNILEEVAAQIKGNTSMLDTLFTNSPHPTTQQEPTTKKTPPTNKTCKQAYE
ncbi:hypothetical protein HmCmsJML017_00595 [Escherichia coli]|uniref:hypothetical protein n=1 Tax=Escherichia coli TaxID=562 RepID=UPI0010C4F865|nr:hypothetical protein [Escherichia coli]GCT15088.1 hypothetical protein HmCmsJML017_00595 [Escherichia coli]